MAAALCGGDQTGLGCPRVGPASPTTPCIHFMHMLALRKLIGSSSPCYCLKPTILCEVCLV